MCNVRSRETHAAREEFSWTDQASSPTERTISWTQLQALQVTHQAPSPSLMSVGICSVHLYCISVISYVRNLFASSDSASLGMTIFFVLCTSCSCCVNNSYLGMTKKLFFFWINPILSSFLCMVRGVAFLLKDNSEHAVYAKGTQWDIVLICNACMCIFTYIFRFKCTCSALLPTCIHSYTTGISWKVGYFSP